MDTVTGTVNDPTPFIIMAYSLATLMMLGFVHWSFMQRLKLRTRLAAVPVPGRTSHSKI